MAVKPTQRAVKVLRLVTRIGRRLTQLKGRVSLLFIVQVETPQPPDMEPIRQRQFVALLAMDRDPVRAHRSARP